METYIIDVRGISYGTLEACHMPKKNLMKGRGETLGEETDF